MLRETCIADKHRHLVSDAARYSSSPCAQPFRAPIMATSSFVRHIAGPRDSRNMRHSILDRIATHVAPSSVVPSLSHSAAIMLPRSYCCAFTSARAVGLSGSARRCPRRREVHLAATARCDARFGRDSIERVGCRLHFHAEGEIPSTFLIERGELIVSCMTARGP
jgi:hypothetical protein